MISSLFMLMLIVAAALAGIALLAGTVALLLTFRIGTALSQHVGGLFSILVVLGLAILVVRGLRMPPHRGLETPHQSRQSDDSASSLRQVSPSRQKLREEDAAIQVQLDPPVESVDSESLAAAGDAASGSRSRDQTSASSGLSSELPRQVHEQIRDASGRVIRTLSMQELPEWVNHRAVARSPRQPTVIIRSQRFATQEEAEKQVQQLARQAVYERLQVHVPRLRRWSPSLPDLDGSGLIRRSCLVTWPVKVGDFEESVVQIYWQLDFTPEMEQRLASVLRQGTVRFRLTTLASLFILAALLMVAGSRMLLRSAD